ncbi:Integrase [Pseudomonas coronafaciens pv. porri]|nr:Integrase [Pseudomonas coronafaciens pv. porri]
MRPVAQIAQSVEQGIENPRVGGSIPSLGTTFRFQVMPSTPESTQKARLVRAFCCLGLSPAIFFDATAPNR